MLKWLLGDANEIPQCWIFEEKNQWNYIFTFFPSYDLNYKLGISPTADELHNSCKIDVDH